MQYRRLVPLVLGAVLAACGGGGEGDDPSRAAAAVGEVGEPRRAALASTSQVAPLYVLDFVAPAATGFGLNDAGDVLGRSHADPGCGPFCLPPEESVVWKGGQRILLPPVPGLAPTSAHGARYINNLGTIAGAVDVIGGSHAVLWRPEGTGYIAQDLGAFPRAPSAAVSGLDDQDRIVGWATTGGAFPTFAAPFMWSQATGMVDLKALGYPNERPAAISPGGKVVTWSSSYQLGDAGSVEPMPPTPQGFVGAGSNGSTINDAGDQAHFLVSINSQSLVYPFRLSAGGTWQQISAMGTGRLSRWRMGSINAAQDVSFTALGTAMVARGPAGIGQPLAALLSPAYPGAAVVDGGPMNAAGQILAQVMIGRSQRLVKLTPAAPCTTDCLVSSSLALTGTFVQDRALPGSCVAGGKMYNQASASVTITSETGAPLANVQVSGRFLDDYWTNQVVTGTTSASGVVRWDYKGPCGTGAIAFLVERASLGARTLDRTRGTLSAHVIPGTAVEPPPPPPPTTNLAPIPVADVSCRAGRTCTFVATGSHDRDGSIAGYRWTDNGGTVWSTLAVFTRTFGKAGKYAVVLQVTDNEGLAASTKVRFTVLR